MHNNFQNVTSTMCFLENISQIFLGVFEIFFLFFKQFFAVIYIFLKIKARKKAINLSHELTM